MIAAVKFWMAKAVADLMLVLATIVLFIAVILGAETRAWWRNRKRAKAKTACADIQFRHMWHGNELYSSGSIPGQSVWKRTKFPNREAKNWRACESKHEQEIRSTMESL